MTPLEEIRAAEARMHITLTNRQRDIVEAWLEGRRAYQPDGNRYAHNVYLSVMAAR